MIDQGPGFKRLLIKIRVPAEIGLLLVEKQDEGLRRLREKRNVKSADLRVGTVNGGTMTGKR